MQFPAIVGEIERHAAGRGVNGGAHGGGKRFGEMPFCRSLDSRQGLEAQVNIIENIGDIPIWQMRCRRFGCERGGNWRGHRGWLHDGHII